MNIPQSIVLFCWMIFLVVWAISAVGVKKNVKGHFWQQGMSIRLVIALIVLFFARNIPLFRQSFHSPGVGHILKFMITENATSHFILSGIGAFLTVIGIALAIWARVNLGRNWGMPMSVKENPDLITTGPYTFVRHPIYTGILIALLGSAFANSWAWLIIVIIFFIYVLISIKNEEELMTKTFPKEYPAYKKRTKALIPFIW